MGIIAGIVGQLDNDEMNHVLQKMFKVQRHRDKKGEIRSLSGNGVAIGMVNHHDTIFCNTSQCDKNWTTEGRNIHQGVRAFTDGIVLDVPKLKQDFDKQGVQLPFPTCSVIVATAYEKWGFDFMNHLEGEFSCVVWDQPCRRLILARDPFGHKPIHYYKKDDAFYFSSEIKGLLAAGVPAEIELTSLSDFLSLNCIPYPATIFKNIYQVPPGSLLIADNEGIRIKKYWEPTIRVDQSISLEDAVSSISSLFKNAVKKRMLEDQTYCFLSGGIDSSAIVSFASEIGGKKVHAVSVGFEEEEENELHDAEIMARHVGAEYHPLIVKPDSFFDMLDTMVFHHDSPFTDTSAYPTYFAAQAGAQFTDIIIAGDGPDQIMGGSGHYVFAVKNDIFANRSNFPRLTARIAAKLLGKLASSPTPTILSRARRKLYRDSLSPVHAAYDVRSYFPDIVKKYLCVDNLWQTHVSNNPYLHPEQWFAEAKDLDDINKYLYADMKFYLPDDLMIKVDRMCMAHGLETLSPFLDRELTSIVNQLPGAFKIKAQNGTIITKHILKDVCKKSFPPEILHKKKQGFGIPLEKWLKKDNCKMIKEVLLDPITLNRPYFKKDALENLVQIFLSGKGDYFYPSPNAIAGLLTFELWHRKYID